MSCASSGDSSAAEPVWVLPEVVLIIHSRQLAEHGGDSGIRDPGLLESALARPSNRLRYEPGCSLARLAAAYASGLAGNHPFVDGNKRVAMVVSLLFLRFNGLVLEAEPAEKYLTFMRLAAGELSEEELGRWLAERVTPVLAGRGRGV